MQILETKNTTFANMKSHLRICLLFLFTLVVFASSCRRDNKIYMGSDAALDFHSYGSPADTIYFDTIFTRLPGTDFPRSVNKQFFIVNRLNQTVKTSVVLAGGQNSFYRINVDGVSSTVFNEIEIPAKDSIIAFVEVTLEANNQLNPALVLDSILFNTNGNEQKVMLAAYGWDAIYYRDSVISQNVIWDDPEKPYVIVNSILVDVNTTLSIMPSVTVYSSPGSSIFVNGTLRAEGTEQDPVVFEGDRLQPAFKEFPGQWRGIHILRESINSEIKNVIVKNAEIGIRVDSLSNNSNPKLRISQTIIRNCSFFGMLGVTATIDAENVAIATCGSNGFIGFFGGIYTLRHCTFASGFSGGRSQPSVALNNIERDDKDNFVRSFPISYSIENCIMFGPLENELILDLHAGTPPTFALIDHCLIKTELYKSALNINNNLINVNPLLSNPRESNLLLAMGSPAIGKAKNLTNPLLIDLTGKSRKTPADIGAYETD